MLGVFHVYNSRRLSLPWHHVYYFYIYLYCLFDVEYV